MEQENKVDYLKIEYNKEWFENNKAHTIYDVTLWKIKDASNIIHPGDHFLLDLYPVDEKSSDVEIWEVILTGIELYDKIRKDKFRFKPIRKITTGKQFGFPNGYWKVKEAGGK